MKKILLILITITALMACKNDAKTEPQEVTTDASQQRTEKQSDGLTLLKGEFIYYADAAVLQTHREMYAVIIDDKMHELDNMAKPFKTRMALRTRSTFYIGPTIYTSLEKTSTCCTKCSASCRKRSPFLVCHGNFE